MSKGLEIDFETRSDVDLKKHGVYRYMASPHTRPLIASYKLNGGPVKRWRHGEPCPADIREHVEAGGIVSAHNNAFERLLWQMILTPRYGWPELKLEQCRCTAATAAALSLPRSLGELGAALALPVQKDKEGTRLINKFSKPRRPRKGEDPNGLYWNEPEDHPEDFDKFIRYCDIDVETEAAADRRMIPLPNDEQELYLLSEKINDRGIRIDMRSVHAALKIAEKARAALDREMTLVTDGYVTAASKVTDLTRWARSQGVDMNSAAKADIEALLECEDLPANVRRAIEIRQEGAKTSVAKLEAFVKRAGADGRIRGAFLFDAASTGRWSSVGVQLHNMPRPRGMFLDAHVDLRTLFQSIRQGDPDLLAFLYGEDLGRPMHLLADSIRSFIWAAPGHDLMVADYSGIEGAVAAWLAGETWKLKAMFELLADPSLPDLYRRAAAGIYNTTTDEITKKDPRRQVGKVSELSLQYQGGAGAFYAMARDYSLKLRPIYEPVWEAADEERRERAVKRYERCLKRNEAKTDVLSREEWLACELVKLGWRATHPAICESWTLLQDAAREAVANPGRQIRVLKCDYLFAKGFLWCRLPSGRCLAYAQPRLKEQVWFRWNDGDKEVMPADQARKLAALQEGTVENTAAPTVTALGVNSVTKKFERFALYGGLAFENIVQAIARDLLANGMRKAESAGYPVIGHVHDEIISEILRGFGDVKEFERLVCDLPPWAAGLPLGSAGWRGKRYRKD